MTVRSSTSPCKAQVWKWDQFMTQKLWVPLTLHWTRSGSWSQVANQIPNKSKVSSHFKICQVKMIVLNIITAAYFISLIVMTSWTNIRPIAKWWLLRNIWETLHCCLTICCICCKLFIGSCDGIDCVSVGVIGIATVGSRGNYWTTIFLIII